MSNLGGTNVSEDTDKDSVVIPGGQVDSIVAGTNIDNIDNTDPVNPIINAAAGGGGGAFSGALVFHSLAQTVNSTTSALVWDSEDYDVGGWHDNVSNTSRLTVPAGVSFVKVSGGAMDTSSVTGQFNVILYKNGINVYVGAATNEIESAGGDGASCSSPTLAVIEGDYFELWMFATTSRTTTETRTWFAIEKVE